MGAMQFEHVETGARATQSRLDEARLDLGHAGVIELGGHLADAIEPRQRRRRHQWPIVVAVRYGMVGLFPAELGRTLAPGMAELQRNLGRRILVDEIDDALPLRFLRIGPEAGAAERDARFWRRAGHFGKDQSHAAQGMRGIMHHVPIGEIAFAVGGILRHGRHDDAVLDDHVA